MTIESSGPQMSRQRFLDVVDELRNILGYALREQEPDPGDELAMEMMYGNFDFAVVHSLVHQPHKVLIECVFGPLPSGRETQVLERLLQMNCALAELDASVFCLDPKTDALIYTLAVEIEGLDGNRLLGKMTEIVWHGRRWLETRFLKEEHADSSERLNPIQLA